MLTVRVIHSKDLSHIVQLYNSTNTLSFNVKIFEPLVNDLVFNKKQRHNSIFYGLALAAFLMVDFKEIEEEDEF